MHYVYILKSAKDGNFYVGRTENIKQRLAEHQNGRVYSTKNRRPLKLVYAEICNSIKDAARRETYLKTAWGKRYIKNRVKYDVI